MVNIIIIIMNFTARDNECIPKKKENAESLTSSADAAH